MQQRKSATVKKTTYYLRPEELFRFYAEGPVIECQCLLPESQTETKGVFDQFVSYRRIAAHVPEMVKFRLCNEHMHKYILILINKHADFRIIPFLKNIRLTTT